MKQFDFSTLISVEAETEAEARVFLLRLRRFISSSCDPFASLQVDPSFTETDLLTGESIKHDNKLAA